MNKKVLVSLVSLMSVALAAVGVSRLIQYYISVCEADPVYHRVEAERYEICFPEYINGEPAFGGLFWGDKYVDDCPFSYQTYILIDEDCTVDDLFLLEFYVYIHGYTIEGVTDSYDVELGEYGRYVISETQVSDEPVSLTIEPLYDYVLV